MLVSTGRWSIEKSLEWQKKVGWRVGCNFSPSSAGNQLEMWQSQTFDLVTISRELKWASDIGMNTIRVYLHDLLFQEDSTGLLQRLDSVFSVAAAHGIGVVPVLFDGVWNPYPHLGEQPEPKPNLHNSIWVQSPGSDIFYNSSRWPELRAYVVGVLQHFKDDDRIVCWDLFNEPDQVDSITLKKGSRAEKMSVATELVSVVFDWAREVNVSQPLTVGVWEYDNSGHPVNNSLNQLIFEQSDIISFHCYEPGEKLTEVIEVLSLHGRPLLCTEWLARGVGSTVDLIEVFADAGVGAINWGLVDGRTQTRFPWRSWSEPVGDDEPWFHELLHTNGKAYDSFEIETIQRVSAKYILKKP